MEVGRNHGFLSRVVLLVNSSEHAFVGRKQTVLEGIFRNGVMTCHL